MGAGFIAIQGRLGKLRKRYINKNWKKILETCVFSFLTATVFFTVAANASNCQDKPRFSSREFYEGPCPDGQYSPIASLLFNTEGGTIRTIMNNELRTSYQEITGFIAIWYFFLCTTYGCWVPSGLFLPGIIIGCAIGQFWFQVYFLAFPGSDPRAD